MDERTTALRVLHLGPALEVRGGVSAVERIILEALRPHVDVRHVATTDDGSLLHKLGVFAGALGQVQRELRAPGPLIVHVHFASRGSTLRKLLLMRMARRAGRPVILHAHGGGFAQFYGELPRPARRMVRRAMGRAAQLIVLSSQWHDFYASACGLPPARLTVLHNPVRIPEQVPDRRGRSAVQLVFLGRMCRSKGTYDALRAFAGLPDRLRSRARLVLAGDGEVEAIRREAAPLGEGVIVLPWIDEKRRDVLLAQSDVFVLPSYQEGVPMAMLESMASGLPVIATPVGGIPDIVSHGSEGLLVPAGDTERLRDAIARLASDEAARLEYGRRARERARTLDISHYASELVTLYRRCDLQPA